MTVEDGQPGTARSSRTEEITSYESAFRRELMAFYAAVVDGAPIETPGRDAMRDIALCQAIIECSRTGRPIDHPARIA